MLNQRLDVHKRWRQFGAMLVIVLVALALRLGYIHRTPPGAQFENVDAQGYHWLARNLLEHGVYSMNTEPPLRADNVRAPLYPLWVAGWYSLGGPSPMVIVLSHALIDTLTVVLAYRLGRWVAGPRIGVTTAALYALNPSSWRFCNELLTEIVFGCLLTAAVWMLERAGLRRADRRRDLVQAQRPVPAADAGDHHGGRRFHAAHGLVARRADRVCDDWRAVDALGGAESNGLWPVVLHPHLR
ncbi:MAG: hypothetical protein GVY30_12120 [Chloroflexi bacterium]|nr:hypothetical protein [Chloroflexota bacterium]